MEKEYTAYSNMTLEEIKTLQRILEREKNPPIDTYEWTEEKTKAWWRRKEAKQKDILGEHIKEICKIANFMKEEMTSSEILKIFCGTEQENQKIKTCEGVGE